VHCASDDNNFLTIRYIDIKIPPSLVPTCYERRRTFFKDDMDWLVLHLSGIAIVIPHKLPRIIQEVGKSLL